MLCCFRKEQNSSWVLDWDHREEKLRNWCCCCGTPFESATAAHLWRCRFGRGCWHWHKSLRLQAITWQARILDWCLLFIILVIAISLLPHILIPCFAIIIAPTIEVLLRTCHAPLTVVDGCTNRVHLSHHFFCYRQLFHPLIFRWCDCAALVAGLSFDFEAWEWNWHRTRRRWLDGDRATPDGLVVVYRVHRLARSARLCKRTRRLSISY